jgi:hypothetical protein
VLLRGIVAMKSHPNVCARRSRCLLFTALILPLALLVAVDRPQCAAARITSPAIAGRTSPKGDVTSLKFGSPNLLGSASGRASSGPRRRDDRGEMVPADATLTWNTFLGGFSILETNGAVATDGAEMFMRRAPVISPGVHQSACSAEMMMPMSQSWMPAAI